MGGLFIFLAALAFHVVGCGAFIYSLPLTLPATRDAETPAVSLSEGAMFASGPFGASGQASISVSMTVSAVSPPSSPFNLFLAFADEAGAASLGSSLADGSRKYCDDKGELVYTPGGAWCACVCCAHAVCGPHPPLLPSRTRSAARIHLFRPRRRCAAACLQGRRLGIGRADRPECVRAGGRSRAAADAAH
jgi:hypothetical protein